MAGADTVYRVLTVYDADTKRAETGVGSLTVVLDHAINLAEHAKELIAHVIELGAEAENTQVALAGLFSAGDFPGAKNFTTAMGEASEIMKQMRKDARDLPGEFEDLKNIFQFAVLGGGEAGKSINQIEHISASLMSVTKALGMSSEIAGREFAELMEGRASNRIALFSKLKHLMGDANMDALKFNSLSAPEKWERIEKALGSFGPMISEYSKTWDAISSTTMDYAKNIVRIGGKDVFEDLKNTLADVNHWYEENEASIMSMARALFGALADAIHIVVGFMREVVGVIGDWVGSVEELLGIHSTAEEKIGTFGKIVGWATVGIIGIRAATLAWEAAQWAINLALSANPIGLIVIAVAALVAGIGILIAELENLRDAWIVLTRDPAMRAVAEKAGFGFLADDITDPAKAKAEVSAAYARMAKREAEHQQLYGSGGITGDVKAMLDKWGVLPGSPAMAHGNIGSPQNVKDMMSMMAGVDVSKAGGPDYAALLNQQKKAAPHTPQMNVRVELIQHINDAEDPARVLRLTKEGIRQSLEHPVRTYIAGVYR